MCRGSQECPYRFASVQPLIYIREESPEVRRHAEQLTPTIIEEGRRGEFTWHKNDQEDERLLGVKSRFRMEHQDRHVWPEEGKFLIVPRGVEHHPVAEYEVDVLLFEAAGTLDTGDVREERTVQVPERIQFEKERSS
jgi:mannose-6-phosphate isomerase-like protein (cupin superfamily)